MFFRREKPKQSSFSDRVQMLKNTGFEVLVQPSGRTRVVRGRCAAEIADRNGTPAVVLVGILIHQDIGRLVDLGYQKIFETHAGVRVAARAAELKALHAFHEDLRETLGLVSLYNQSLGTINQAHLYDRVEDRDHGVEERPWE
ncbi:MAG: hypothetical protein FJW20_19685 [Acidimicrobiia bacterium]|nr:hypothetical protein [Acidimicrobiia bacterium]